MALGNILKTLKPLQVQHIHTCRQCFVMYSFYFHIKARGKLKACIDYTTRIYNTPKFYLLNHQIHFILQIPGTTSWSVKVYKVLYPCWSSSSTISTNYSSHEYYKYFVGLRVWVSHPIVSARHHQSLSVIVSHSKIGIHIHYSVYQPYKYCVNSPSYYVPHFI